MHVVITLVGKSIIPTHLVDDALKTSQQNQEFCFLVINDKLSGLTENSKVLFTINFCKNCLLETAV